MTRALTFLLLCALPCFAQKSGMLQHNRGGATAGAVTNAIANNSGNGTNTSLYGSTTFSGSGGYIAYNVGTNAILAAPTNWVANPLLGAKQWVFPTNNINILHVTNQPGNIQTNIPFTLLVNTIGLGVNVRLSWTSTFRAIGVATTNDAVLVSNKIHHIEFETYGPGQTNTSIAIGYGQ